MAIFGLFTNKSGETDRDLTVEEAVRTCKLKIKRNKKALTEIADIGTYKSPSGGFVNFAKFSVAGTNPATGKTEAKLFRVPTKEIAIALAKKAGLEEPYKVVVYKMQPPTEEQIKQLIKLQLQVPRTVCKLDLDALFARIFDEDETPPETGIAVFANSLGIRFSRFIGRIALYRNIISRLDKVQLATFYVYAVYISEKGIEMGNPKNLSIYPILESIGKELLQKSEYYDILKECGAYEYAFGPKKDNDLFQDARLKIFANNLMS
ncbi:MAG: hypothetical protein ACI4M9_04270 [Succinivibrio sp.]